MLETAQKRREIMDDPKYQYSGLLEEEQENLKQLKMKIDKLPLPYSLTPDEIQISVERYKRKKKRHLSFMLFCLSFLSLVLLCLRTLSSEKEFDATYNIDSAYVVPNPLIIPASTTEHSAEPSESYEQVFRVMKKNQAMYYQEFAGESCFSLEAKETQSTSDTSNFYETNIQVSGIDEGDIIKTDGTYLYLLNGSDLSIIDTQKGDMKKAAKLNLLEGTNYIKSTVVQSECYLNGKFLIVLLSLQDDGKDNTVIRIYNVENPYLPLQESTLTQSGRYLSSRLTGSILYTFSAFHTAYNFSETDETPELVTFIPSINEKPIAFDCIYIPSESTTFSYTVISSVDLKSPSKFCDQNAVLADGNFSYVSPSYVYFASNYRFHRENGNLQTEINRFSIQNGFLKAAGGISLEGSINNQFSMDEYNGYFRVITTVDEYKTVTEKGNNFTDMKRSNALYIFNSELTQIASIEELAEEEQVYSARFMEDMLYFVTFRQTDPLFSADLSDPYHPKIIGSLKIPGFSSYLHPFSDNLLFGLGREVDEKTGVVLGIKLSMFDISDPTDVKEIDKTVIENQSIDSLALSNHKAVFAAPEKNIIGFEVQYYYESFETSYLTYSYSKKKGFVNTIDKNTTSINPMVNSEGRAVYIGDTLYIAKANWGIQAISLIDNTLLKQLDY